MTKKLTSKLKEEIVETQIDFIKNKYPNDLINYDILKSYLIESLNDYPKSFDKNSVDIDFLNSLGGKSNKVATRLLNEIKKYYYSYKNEETPFLKNSHLLEAFKDKRGFRIGSHAGKKSWELLEKYLVKKNLI